LLDDLEGITLGGRISAGQGDHPGLADNLENFADDVGAHSAGAVGEKGFILHDRVSMLGCMGQSMWTVR